MLRSRRADFHGSFTDRFSGSITNAGTYVKQRAWLWPIIGFAVLLTIGIWVHSEIETTMKENLASELKTLLDVEADMLRSWLTTQQNNAESMANSEDVRAVASKLIFPDESDQPTDVSDASAVASTEHLNKQLAKLLAPSNVITRLRRLHSDRPQSKHPCSERSGTCRRPASRTGIRIG